MEQYKEGPKVPHSTPYLESLACTPLSKYK